MRIVRKPHGGCTLWSVREKNYADLKCRTIFNVETRKVDQVNNENITLISSIKMLSVTS